MKVGAGTVLGVAFNAADKSFDGWDVVRGGGVWWKRHLGECGAVSAAGR